AAVQQEQGERRRDMEADDEGEVGRLGRRLLLHEPLPVTTEPGGYQDGVSEAGHREELGGPLQETYDDRLQVAELLHGLGGILTSGTGDPGTRPAHPASLGAGKRQVKA